MGSVLAPIFRAWLGAQLKDPRRCAVGMPRARADEPRRIEGDREHGH